AGLYGTAAIPDFHLGRIVEREPNPTATQACRLPPAFARTVLDVAGNLASSSTYYGTAAPTDGLRDRGLADSRVSRSVAYRSVDPVGGGPTTVTLEVRSAAGQLLAAASSGNPLVATFDLASGADALVTLAVTAGTTPWLATFTTTDLPLPMAPAKPPQALPAAWREAPAGAPCSEQHVLVHLREGVDASGWAQRGGHVLGEPTGGGTWRVQLAQGGVGARKAAKALASDPDVAWSEPDWVLRPLGTSNDARLAQQWNLRAVGAFEAWDTTRGSSSVTVGVLDSGVLAHPDLAGQLVTGYDFVSDAASAGDGDGRDTDPTDAGDRGDPSGTSTWHGTHVTSLLVGKADDGAGIAGLAPGCKVMHLRVLGRSGGLASDVADALRFAAGLFTTQQGRRLPTPLRVVNLSLGTEAYSSELDAACSAAANRGVLLVAATGNTGSTVLYPAAFPNVMAVGAVDAQLRGTSYTSRGPEVDLVAPGGTSLQDADGDGWPDAVLGASRDETLYPAPLAHAWQAGTSEACPHVSAAAALLLSVDSTLTAAQLRTRLLESALDLGLGGRDDLYGAGLLQVHTALKRLLADRGTPLAVGPRLHLPMDAVRLLGFESTKRLPLVNSGTGTLVPIGAQAVTDDGGDWLGANYIANFPGADVSASHLEVTVDRTRLRPGDTWASGTLRLYSSTGALGLVRVVVALPQNYPRAGVLLQVAPFSVETGGVPTLAVAHAENDYRFFVGGLTAGSWLLRAGEDLDADGFSCEATDACGWYGGATQALAVPIPLAAGQAVEGLGINLSTP
ncbi:MAG: S8 family serine peptidase, partial [Planctomycetia bacterium]